MGGQDNDKAAEHDDWLYRYCGKGNKCRVGTYCPRGFSGSLKGNAWATSTHPTLADSRMLKGRLKTFKTGFQTAFFIQSDFLPSSPCGETVKNNTFKPRHFAAAPPQNG